ncbi:MAG: phosphate transport system permease protein [Actinomycetota bacterium]|jgi:phosphate transport system permease protein
MSRLLSDTPTQPWKIVDPEYRIQQLVTHLGTPLLALLFTVVSPMSGFSGFTVTWFIFHTISAGLLAKYGKKKKSFANAFLEVFVGATIFVFVSFVATVLWPVISNGMAGVTHLNLIFQDAAKVGADTSLNKGGLGHAIVGTIIMVGIATLISVPIGILAALYVTEVRGKLTPFVRFFVQAMSGVPSIVAGLFIYSALIVSGILQYSGFAGALALSILMLPTVARTAEEILRLIPDDLRTAALALGGTQWRTVRMVVLPAAKSGLITSAILGIARVAGETAPLLLTAFGNNVLNLNPFSDSMSALPSYVFTQFLLGGDNDVKRAWFATFVLLVAISILFTAARIVADRMKRN